jgi:hypothetical protein
VFRERDQLLADLGKKFARSPTAASTCSRIHFRF